MNVLLGHPLPGRRACRWLFPALLAFGLAGGSASADQNDPRLDGLFGELLTTSDFSRAGTLTTQIWEIWVETGDPDVDQLMTDGMNALDVGDFKRALEAFDQVVVLRPAFAEGWNKRATVYYLMGRMDDSLVDVERTLDLEPRHFGALSGRGLIYMATGKMPQALDAFEEALGTNPYMPAIQERLEWLREELKDSAI